MYIYIYIYNYIYIYILIDIIMSMGTARPNEYWTPQRMHITFISAITCPLRQRVREKLGDLQTVAMRAIGGVIIIIIIIIIILIT